MPLLGGWENHFKDENWMCSCMPVISLQSITKGYAKVYFDKSNIRYRITVLQGQAIRTVKEENVKEQTGQYTH